MEALRSDREYTHYEWECYTVSGETRNIKGAWILCDQGYQPWGTMICAYASAQAGTEMVPFNNRLGSVRKDIEDTFGIMKKRFRILRLPFLYKPAQRVGSVFKACAILHNMLLDYDQLDDIGQDEEHWIEADNRATRESLAQVGRVCPAAQDRDYTYLGQAFIPLGRPPLEDARRHHGLKDALLEHFTYVRKAEMLKWLKIAARITSDKNSGQNNTSIEE